MDHNEVDMFEMCQRLYCRLDNRGYFAAGPALEGTPCGDIENCIKGECVYE